jgi:hypothetical protein
MVQREGCNAVSDASTLTVATSGCSMAELYGLPPKKDQKGGRRMFAYRPLKALLACAVLAGFLMLAGPAWAQASQHLRGTLTAFQDHTLTVQTSRGNTETIKLADDAKLFLVTRADMAAIKSGRFVGITSVEQGGKRVAREVHVFDESLRGLGEGHYPWDLDTGPNMMTNANIAQVQEVGGDRVLKLNYSGGEQTIAIPPNADVVAFDKTTPDQLVAGRKVFLILKKQNDGTNVVSAVVVGADGVKPPM